MARSNALILRVDGVSVKSSIAPLAPSSFILIDAPHVASEIAKS